MVSTWYIDALILILYLRKKSSQAQTIMYEACNICVKYIQYDFIDFKAFHGHNFSCLKYLKCGDV